MASTPSRPSSRRPSSTKHPSRLPL
jgi:hypothetical protein